MEIYYISLVTALFAAIITWLYTQKKYQNDLLQLASLKNIEAETASTISQLQTEIKTLTEKNQNLETTIAVTNNKNQDLSENIKLLQNKNDSNNEELKQLNGSMLQTTASLKTAETQAINYKETSEQQKQEHSRYIKKAEEQNQLVTQLKEKNADLNANIEQITKQFNEKSTQLTTLNNHNDQLRDKNNTLESNLHSLNTTITEREDKLTELKAQFEQQKQSLSNEFKSLSQEILKEKQTALITQNKDGINALLEPLQQQIKRFETRVNEVHNEQTKGQTKLETQINHLSQMSSSLKTEADNLAKALKNDKKMQGNWGEIQVERLLEDAGLQKGKEFKREDSFKNIDGDTRRPDFVIYLPENKHIIIDSKVSLNAYVSGVNAQTEEERKQALDQHVANINKHIDTLSSKEYSSLVGMNSPDFVFMFMPIESAYLAAFEHDPSLFTKAYNQKIAIVTPNTLLPILRTIASLWNIEKQNQSTKQLALAAEKIYGKLRIFSEKFIKIESQLTTVAKSYDEARKSLTGPRSLISMAEGFKDLGVKVQKDLPADLVDESKPELNLIKVTGQQ